MEIKSLKCNHCSADLQINPKIKFFNCNFCGSSLTIKNSGGAIYTEVIGEIKENTDSILDNSNTMLLEQQLERVDREWLLEREQYMVHGKNGSSEPTSAGTTALVIVPIVMLIFGVIIISQFNSSPVRHSQGTGVPITITIAVVSIFCIASAVKNSNKVSGFSAANEKYEKRRNEILE